MNLLTTSNHKTLKGEASGYLTGILHLAPANLSGINVCRFSTPGCKAACLNTAGKGRFAITQQARIRKTLALFRDQSAFAAQLDRDIISLCRKAARLGLKPAVRLNGTSDLPWEKMPAFQGLFARFPSVQFYDYTKDAARARDHAAGLFPPNYHLTYSASERDSDAALHTLLSRGVSIAVVTPTPSPRMLAGDNNDLRFLDPPGSIIALSPKGKARHDRSGFVRFHKVSP
jgi:hypothetical protein